MLKALRRLMASVSLSLFISAALAQPADNNGPAKKEIKPFKVVTSGKQVTIKSSREISHIMLWTSGGNRLVEQKDIRNNNFSFTIPVNGSYFFLMIGLANGKVYTEKIGIRW
jgi:hypothetical protein